MDARAAKAHHRLQGNESMAAKGTGVPVCVYCETNPADSREHWLPQWMGSFRAADVLRDRVCTPCNKDLGDRLDHEMSRTGPEALDRFHMKIGDSDTDWERSNPFNFRRQQGEPPTMARVRAPEDDHDLLMEDIPGAQPPRRRPQRQIILTNTDGRGHPVPLPTHASVEWLREAIRQRGLEGARLAEIVCEAAEGNRLPDWARRTLDQVFPDAKNIDWSLPDGGSYMVVPSLLVMGVRAEYFRALAKLAFHYFLQQCPEIDGRDPAFEPIRRFIRDGTGAAGDFVNPNEASFVLRPLGLPLANVTHFFFLEADDGRVVVRMRLFAGSPYNRPAIRVTIADPSPIMEPRRLGHALKLFAERPLDGYDGEMVPLRVVQHEGRSGVWGP
jgi:hypothetical protein